MSNRFIFPVSILTPRRLFMIFFLLVLSNSIYGQTNWVKEKVVDGITAYSRIKEGKDYYEFRTVFQVHTSLSTISDFICNMNNFKNWMPNCIESIIYKRDNDSVFYAYTITEAPWPASNRDVAFKVIREKTSPQVTQITLRGVSYPLSKNNVRVKDYHAVWILTAKSPDIVVVDYTASFHPGSNYPNWLIKNSLIDARINVSQKLIQMLKK